MNELYAIAFKLCIQALIPNPFTVMNLPDHQKEYIFKAAAEVCREETKDERLMMCIQSNFIYKECLNND